MSNNPSFNRPTMTGEFLSDIFVRLGKSREQADDLVETVIARFGSFEVLAGLTTDELTRTVGENVAILIKLMAYICSRRVTDNFAFGIEHTDEEIYELAIATFLGLSRETVYVMSFDGEDRAIGFDYVSEGTVNASEVYPRLIVEASLRRGAVSIILAHNHPLGVATPSDADVGSTMRIAEVLRASGIRLRAHITVAESECAIMTPTENFLIDGSVNIEYYNCKSD